MHLSWSHLIVNNVILYVLLWIGIVLLWIDLFLLIYLAIKASKLIRKILNTCDQIQIDIFRLNHPQCPDGHEWDPEGFEVVSYKDELDEIRACCSEGQYFTEDENHNLIRLVKMING